MSELARVSSERTALQVQVDKQAKAAREEALLGARSPLRLSVLYRFGFLLFLSTGAARCARSSLLLPCVVSVALVVPLSFTVLVSLVVLCWILEIFVGFVLPYIRQTFAYPSDTHPPVRFSVARPIVDVMGPEQRRAAQLRHDGAARPGAGMGAGTGRRPGKQPRTLFLPSSLCRCRDLLFLGST